MPQQAQDDSRVSIKDFVSGIRSQVNDPSMAAMSDEDIARKVFEVDPSLMKGVQTVEPRRKMQQPQAGAFDRFTQGMAAVPTDIVTAPFKSETYKGMGQNITKNLMSMVGSQSTRQQMTEKMTEESKAAGGASAMIDAPNIKKDWQSGNKAGAAGRATTQALMAGTMLKGAMPEAKAASTMGEMEAIGEGAAKDPYMNIAKTVTKAHSMALDEQIGNIEKSMENQFVDAQKVATDAAYAKKIVGKLKQVPDAQALQVKAAKDAIDQLSAKLKANPRLMPWKDAREALKNVKEAKKAFGPGTARSAMEEIQSTLEDRLQESANVAGQGEAYKKWISDYRKMSNLQRAGARIMRGQSQAQVETKMTAKEGTRIGTRRFGMQIGDSKAGKISAQNAAMLKKWHKSLQELDQQIKTAPKKATPLPASPLGQGTPTEGESAIEQARRQR